MTFSRPALLASVALLSLGAAHLTPAAAMTSTTNITQEAETNINAPYNAFLAKYITEQDGIHLVDYAGVTAEDRASLSAYVKALEALTPSTMSREEKLAYYANIYNAKTIEIILDNYPVTSIRKIGGNLVQPGPWNEKVLTIEGKELSLNNVEHDIVRADFDEPRVHYAFNCASIGCPNLMIRAWEAETLEEDFDAAARAYIAHPRGVNIDDRGRVQASSIYKWFKKDFGRNDGEVLDHIRQYATGEKLEKLNAATKINSYDYDWDLNEV